MHPLLCASCDSLWFGFWPVRNTSLLPRFPASLTGSIGSCRRGRLPGSRTPQLRSDSYIGEDGDPIPRQFNKLHQRARGRLSPGDPVNCDCLRGSACGGWRHLQDVSAEAEEVRYEVRELIEVEHAVVLREDVGDLTLSVTVFAARHLRIEQLPCLSLSHGALGVNS